MESSKILLKNGQTVDLVDGRIADGDITSWNNKINVDGSNATNEGVTAMMKQVASFRSVERRTSGTVTTCLASTSSWMSPRDSNSASA